MALTKQSVENLNPTIAKILRSRARRFSVTSVLLMLVLLVFVEAYIFSVEVSRVKMASQNWLDQNELRISQALFLQHALAIKGLLDETTQLNSGDSRIAGLIVQDLNRDVVATSGNVADSDVGFLRREAKLYFAERPQGYISIVSAFDLNALIQSAAITLLLTVAIVVAINLSAKSQIDVIRAAVLNPLQQFTDAPQSSLRANTLDLLVDERIFSSSALEIQQLVSSQNRLIRQVANLTEKEKLNAQLLHKAELATQISHDIRSPLSALKMLVGVSSQLQPEERSLIQAVAKRIESIAQSLLDEARKDTVAIASQAIDLNSELNAIIAEKRQEFVSKQIVWSLSCKNSEALAAGDSTKFASIMSNLINNAAEAVSFGGKISVVCESTDDRILISISDNGVGIPQTILDRLGREKISFGKLNGNGIGFFTSAEVVKSFGGAIEVHSKLGQGTKIIIQMLKYHEQFSLQAISNIGGDVVVIDDDLSMCEAWKISLSSHARVQSFNRIDAFERKFQKGEFAHTTLFLVDHEFENSDQTGIDLISRLNLHDRAILVSGAAKRSAVRLRAEQNRIRFMSKEDAAAHFHS